jgi:hypothetical protein
MREKVGGTNAGGGWNQGGDGEEARIAVVGSRTFRWIRWSVHFSHHVRIYLDAFPRSQ